MAFNIWDSGIVREATKEEIMERLRKPKPMADAQETEYDFSTTEIDEREEITNE